MDVAICGDRERHQGVTVYIGLILVRRHCRMHWSVFCIPNVGVMASAIISMQIPKISDYATQEYVCTDH